MTYAGKVIDGPLEGRWIEQDEPWFHHNWQPRMRMADWRWDDPPKMVYAHRFYYRWMQSYRAWVWVQE